MFQGVLFNSPWGSDMDNWMNIIYIMLLIVCAVPYALNKAKKIDVIKMVNCMSIMGAAVINCNPILLFKWFLAILLIILDTMFFRFGYCIVINQYARRQLKKVYTQNKWEANELEDKYDSLHSKEELAEINKEAARYPRVGLVKYFILSILPSILFFIILILLGNKYSL